MFSGLQLGVNKPLQIKINSRDRPSSPSQSHTKTNQTDGRQKTKQGCRLKMNLTTLHGFDVSSVRGRGQPSALARGLEPLVKAPK
jgi:hypothetical protein